MKGSPKVPNRVAIDASIFIAFLLDEPEAQYVEQELFDNPKVNEIHCSHLALSETFYILCRKKGVGFATEAMETLERTAYVRVHGSNELDYSAGGYKCSRKLSLADCYVLALAKLTNSAAIFARRERDLGEEHRKNPIDVELLFLEELTRDLRIRSE
ncbi:MAG: PIN domain-containing protein [Candidatus Binatia bacterium]